MNQPESSSPAETEPTARRASTNASEAGPIEDRWLPWVAILLLAGAIVPVWCCRYFPSHNGPSLISIAHLLRYLDDPEYGYSTWYERHLFPVPYLAQLGLSLPFLGWLSPTVILKLQTSLVILLRFGAVWYWLRQISRSRVWLALAVLPLAYEFSVMRGYFNFHMGISLGLILMGWHLRHRDRWSLWTIAVLNLLTLATYFCHAFPLIITGFLLAAYEIGRTGSIRRIPGLVVRSFLPSIVLLVAFSLHSRDNSGWGASEITYSSLREKFSHVHARCATPLSEFVNLGSLALLAAPVLLAVWRGTRSNSGRADETCGSDGTETGGWNWSPFWLVWATGTGVYLASPSNLLGWHKAELHILPYALLTWLSVAPLLATRGKKLLFAGATAALVLGGALPQIRALQAGSATVAEYLAGLDSMPRRVAMLSLTGTSEESSGRREVFNPTQWSDSYYLIDRGGGLGRSLVANNTIYPVWFHDFRDGGRVQFPPVDPSNPTTEELDRAAHVYGGVLLWDCSEALELALRKRGFETVFSEGRLRILRNITILKDSPSPSKEPP